MLNFIIVYIAFILSTTIRISSPREYGTSSKYKGYYIYSTGSAIIEPFHSTTEFNSKDDCNRKCKYTDECLATSFEKEKMICTFYNTTNFNIYYPGEIQFSKWRPSDFSKKFQPHDGRCFGYWFSFHDQYITVKDYGYLLNISTTTDECMGQCLKNNLCGYFNMKKKESKCNLVPKWPYFNINWTNKTNSTVYKWTCVRNFINNITIPKQESQPNLEKCSGYWNISNHHYILNSNDRIWSNFHTQYYNDCLKECNRYSNCFRVYFNLTYSLCILYKIEQSHKIPFENMTAIVFEWICLKNDSRHPPMNEDEKRYLNMGMGCYRIVNDENLHIGMDECGKYPPISKFELCSSGHDTYDWTITDSCYVNQSYWMFPSQTISMNDTNGLDLWNLTKIFTGLQTYWLAHLDNKNFMRVNYRECRIFNAGRPKDNLQSNEIISRSDRQALPSKGPVQKYSKTPTYFVISSSELPYHSCKTRAAGIDILRWLQICYMTGKFNKTLFYDIPYNFMIDDDGNIYEAAGWSHTCKYVDKYNTHSICVAYIGSFKSRHPREKFLNSLKKLIEFAVDKRFLNRDYTLYIHQDLYAYSVHRNLWMVIKNWNRYRGFHPEDCKNMSNWIISLNLMTFLILGTLGMTLTYTMFTFKKSCKKCKFLSENNLELKQLNSSDSTTKSLNKCDNASYANIIIYEKPTLISGRAHFEVIKRIKFWFYYQSLNCISPRFSGNTFTHYLNSNPHITRNMIVLEVVCEKIDEYEPFNTRVITCVSDIKMLAFLKSLVKSGFCICQYFAIDPVDVTNLFMNISTSH